MDEEASDDEITVNVNWHINPTGVNPRLETARSLTLAIIDQGDAIGPLWTGTWERFIADAERSDKDGAWSAIHDLALALALTAARVAQSYAESDDEAARRILNAVFDFMGRPADQ